MMLDKPLISIVVACYNTEKYIESCLDSILHQSYSNIEIICVDDCSTDDTERLVRQTMKKDNRIKWLSTEKNSGLSDSRNLGLEYCQGEYVMFVDGDDCLLPESISKLYTSMDDDDCVVIGGAIVNYEEDKEQYGILVDNDRNYYTIKHEIKTNALSDISATMRLPVNAWGKLWRMSVIKANEVKFPSGLLYEDACFLWKYLLVAPYIHTIKTPIVKYHRHMEGSIMSDTFKKSPRMSINHIFILEDIFNFAVLHHSEHILRSKMTKLYEDNFWNAYNMAPSSDYEEIFSTMCRILREQRIDTTTSPALQYVARYDEISKSEIFMEAYKGVKGVGIDISPLALKLTGKLAKYRKLTKLFVCISSLLLVILMFVILRFYRFH